MMILPPRELGDWTVLLGAGLGVLDPLAVSVKELGSSMDWRRDDPRGRDNGGGGAVVGDGGAGAAEGGGGGAALGDACPAARIAA